MVMKIKKRRKSRGQRGTTRYHGARKKWKSSGHKGGKGMSGTGKRADHKKSLVIKLYGNNYFGKQGITSKSTRKIRKKIMNLKDIECNYDSLMKKYGKDNILDLSGYKILGEGELTKKLTIKASAFSKKSKKTIEKAGGKIIEEKASLLSADKENSKNADKSINKNAKDEKKEKKLKTNKK